MWRYGKETIKVSYHSAKLGGHRHSSSGHNFFFFFTWSWRKDVTSTYLIRLIWVKSFRCTYLPILVIIGFIEMEISIFILILTWIPWKKLNSPLLPAILLYFWNQEHRFTIPKFRIRLAKKTRRRRTQVIAKRCAFHTSVKSTAALNRRFMALLNSTTFRLTKNLISFTHQSHKRTIYKSSGAIGFRRIS